MERFCRRCSDTICKACPRCVQCGELLSVRHQQQIRPDDLVPCQQLDQTASGSLAIMHRPPYETEVPFICSTGCLHIMSITWQRMHPGLGPGDLTAMELIVRVVREYQLMPRRKHCDATFMRLSDQLEKVAPLVELVLNRRFSEMAGKLPARLLG